jgi:hypothetical protein
MGGGIGKVMKDLPVYLVGLYLVGFVAFSITFLVFDLPTWIYRLWVAILLLAFFLVPITSIKAYSSPKASEEMTKDESASGNAKAFITMTKIYPLIKDLQLPDLAESTVSAGYVRKALDTLQLGDIYMIAYNESDPIPLKNTIDRYKEMIENTPSEDIPETIVALLTNAVFILIAMRDMIKQLRPSVGG